MLEELIDLVKHGLGHDVKDLGSGRRVVTTAGTRVKLVELRVSSKAVCITAEDNNTGVIVIGGNGVIAALATREGTPLDAGDSAVVPCDDLSDIWLDSTVSGDGVTYTNFVGG